MKFDEIVGQDELKRKLAEQIDSGRISHAQLFTGLSGYGTLQMAFAYIQYLFCTNRHDGDSCGECPSCRMLDFFSHPDLHMVFPVNKREKKSGEVVTSDMFLDKWRDLCLRKGALFTPTLWYEQLDLGKNMKGMITAKESENMIKKLSLKPYASSWKAMLIWLPETMNQDAANKILKILEEPWDRTVFILVSEHPELLLPTIKSRTQEVVVPPIDSSILEELAHLWDIDYDTSRIMARICKGSLIEFSTLIHGGCDETRSGLFELFCRLMRLCYADKHMELMGWADDVALLSREGQVNFLKNTARLLRESYMKHIGMDAITYLWGEEDEFCTKFAPYIDNTNIEPLVAECERAIAEIDQYCITRVLFSHFALNVSKLIRKPQTPQGTISTKVSS